MSENDKREKKKLKKRKSKENSDTATNTENTEVQKVKKPKDNSHKQETNSEPEPEQKKIKKRKNKDVTTNIENIEDKPIKTRKKKSEKQREDISEPEPDVSEPKKNKKRASVSFTPETIDNEPETNEFPDKRQKTEETRLPTDEELLEVQKPENIKDVGSKRQQKRQKYEKLLADTKLKQDAVSQEKALNYLSRWKHNRTEWKFKKMQQVWLQNHMFESVILPEKFFDILVEYFGGSNGKIKEVLIETCLKIVDEAEGNEDTVNDVKFKRARTLLQFLQE